MSEVPQPVLTSSDMFRKNYGAVDWSAKRKQAPKKATPASTRRTTSTVSSSRPHVSANAAVHRDQVARFNKEATHGVHYEKDGSMVSTSYSAREREARRRGLSFG